VVAAYLSAPQGDRRGATHRNGPLPILPCNAEIVRVFLSCQTQWCYAGQSAAPVSLDYGRVEAVLRMLAIKKKRRPAIFQGLRIMEAAALKVLQEQHSQALKRATGRGR